jgi:hypothetical protein
VGIRLRKLKRFTKETIDKLVDLKWWDWELKKITANVQNLTDDKIDNFLKIISLINWSKV